MSLATAGDNEDQKPDANMTDEQYKAHLTDEQKQFIHSECTRLMKESEGFEDAKQYIGDILFDFTCKWEDHEDLQEQLRNVVIEKLRLLDV